MAMLIWFLAFAFGMMGGVRGGGIFVPMLNLIVGFDTKFFDALSKCNISLYLSLFLIGGIIMVMDFLCIIFFLRTKMGFWGLLQVGSWGLWLHRSGTM